MDTIDSAIERYLTLNRDALGELPLVERIEMLGELARHAGTWLSDERGRLIDELRDELGGGDATVAEHLGVSKQAVATAGDGPTTPSGVRPRLLRRGAEIILEHGRGNYLHELQTALKILRERRPDEQRLRAAARRICTASNDVTSVTGMPYTTRRTYMRAVQHAGEVRDGTQWRPDGRDEDG